MCYVSKPAMTWSFTDLACVDDINVDTEYEPIYKLQTISYENKCQCYTKQIADEYFHPY
jgi:hypothetical protein